MSDSPPNKGMPIDRLSSLPDPLLLHILSFLGVKKAAITSVLSKRWEFMWAQLPSLVFSEESQATEKIRELVSTINRTLRIRNGIHLEWLGVYVCYDNSLAPDVEFWVDSAIQNKTNTFFLQLVAVRENELYKLTEKMYSNPPFRRMCLRGCLMDTERMVEWKSLAYLHLDHMKLSQHVIENILSGSPNLHILFLDKCWGFKCLKVNSHCLRYLKVIDNDEVENWPSLEISAPCVKKLDILFYPEGRTLMLRNMTSLLEVIIDFSRGLFTNYEEVMNTTKEIYERIQHVDDIHLGRHYFMFISEMVVNGWKMPISRRSILSIVAFNEDEQSIAGIFSMLESSPKLVEVGIKGFNPQTFQEVGYQAAKHELSCDLLNLKFVKLSEYANWNCGGEIMLTVVEAILKRAPVLEEMWIRLNITEARDRDNVFRRLHACPRSSGKIVIRLHP